MVSIASCFGAAGNVAEKTRDHPVNSIPHIEPVLLDMPNGAATTTKLTLLAMKPCSKLSRSVQLARSFIRKYSETLPRTAYAKPESS